VTVVVVCVGKQSGCCSEWHGTGWYIWAVVQSLRLF